MNHAISDNWFDSLSAFWKVNRRLANERKKMNNKIYYVWKLLQIRSICAQQNLNIRIRMRQRDQRIECQCDWTMGAAAPRMQKERWILWSQTRDIDVLENHANYTFISPWNLLSNLPFCCAKLLANSVMCCWRFVGLCGLQSVAFEWVIHRRHSALLSASQEILSARNPSSVLHASSIPPRPKKIHRRRSSEMHNTTAPLVGARQRITSRNRIVVVILPKRN